MNVGAVSSTAITMIDRAPGSMSFAPKAAFMPGTGAPTGWLFFAFVFLLGLYTAMPANADEIRPALLDIKEQNTGLFAVTWKVPTRGNRALAITPQLPASLELLGTPTLQDMPGTLIKQATYKNNAASLTGQTIVIDGLSALQTDVLLLVQLQDGTQHSAILRPASPEFTIPLQASKLKVAGDYWRMGTIHILEGVDHLLFVLALLLIVSGLGSLPATDGRRTPALPLDRVIIAVGAGVEWQWKGFELHHNLNYADLGDGDLDQDNGLAGGVKGSFDTNYAVVLDNQIIKRF